MISAPIAGDNGLIKNFSEDGDDVDTSEINIVLMPTSIAFYKA
jgi:hypothetical protein